MTANRRAALDLVVRARQLATSVHIGLFYAGKRGEADTIATMSAKLSNAADWHEPEWKLERDARELAEEAMIYASQIEIFHKDHRPNIEHRAGKWIALAGRDALDRINQPEGITH